MSKLNSQDRRVIMGLRASLEQAAQHLRTLKRSGALNEIEHTEYDTTLFITLLKIINAVESNAR